MSEPILFYEDEFFCLSNFSAFAMEWRGKIYITSEHAYQSEKFDSEEIKEKVRNALSPALAHSTAHTYEKEMNPDFRGRKLIVMEEILREKLRQHETIRQKLIESGNRELVKKHSQDLYWGMNEKGEGENNLGKLWMKLRAELV